MSYYSSLGKQHGQPKWQVFYGDTKPPGDGWQRVGNNKIENLTTEAKWYRAYTYVGREKQAPASTGIFGKLKSIASRAMFGDPETPKEQPQTIKNTYHTGDRVVLQDGKIGYITKDDQQAQHYTILDPRTRLTQDVPEEQIVRKEQAKLQHFKKGDEVGTSSITGAVHDVDPQAGHVHVKDPTGKVHKLYPEELSHGAEESEKDIQAITQVLKKRGVESTGGSLWRMTRGDKPILGGPVTTQERAVLAALVRASRDGRYLVTKRELVDDLKTHEGQDIVPRDFDIALQNLSAMYKPLVLDQKNGISIEVGRSRKGLDHMANELGIQITDPHFGWTPVCKPDEIHAQSGLPVVFSNVRATIELADGIETDAKLSEGTISRINKGRTFFNVKDAQGQEYEVPSDRLVFEEGKTLWDSLKHKDGRKIVPDPCNPDLWGSVLRDNFWVLRDREHVQGIVAGATVRTMPYSVRDAQGAESEQPMPGQVIDKMPHTGLVRVKLGDGRVLDLSPRQLTLARPIGSVSDVYDLARVRRYAVYGGAFTTDTGATVEFGYDRDDKAQGKSSVTRITFADEEDFNQNYSAFFQKGEYGLATRLAGAMTKKENMFDTQTPPFIPNAGMMRVLRTLWPHADALSAKHYMDSTTGRFTIDLGLNNSVGKPFSMGHIMTQVFPDRPDKDAMDADTYDSTHPQAGRMEVTTDGNSIYLRVGKNLMDEDLSGKMPYLKALADKKTRKVTLYNLVNSNRVKLAEVVGGKDPELYRTLCRFIYDPRGRRFVADLSDYHREKNAVLGLATRLFSGSPIHESADGAWWHDALAGNGQVSKTANEYTGQLLATVRARQTDVLPDIKDLKHKDGNELYSFQRTAVNFITTPGQNATLLAFDQGTGKTATTLAAILRLRDQGRLKKALIAVPASIMQNWQDEMSDWTNGKSASFVSRLHGANRREVYAALNSKNPPLITITSFNTLVQDYKELAKQGFDLVAVDEAQALKNEQTKRASLIKSAFSDVPIRIAATGTPTENNPEDLHSIMEFLSPETFGDRKKFINDFIEYDTVVRKDTGETKEVPVGIKNATVLRNKLTPLMMRVSKDDLKDALQKEEQARRDAAGKKGKLGLLLGNRDVYPWPALVWNDKAQAYDVSMTANPRNAELLVARDVEDAPEYWKAHSRALQIVSDQVTNPLTRTIRMQQVADDPSIFGATIGERSAHFKDREMFMKFDEQNADGSFKYKNPKRDRMLEIVKKHVADPKNGKVIIFSQYATVVDRIHRWLYSDPEIRKYLGVGDKQYTDSRVTSTLTDLPGVLTYRGGMGSKMSRDEAAAIAQNISSGIADVEEPEALKKERAWVVNEFQTNPKTKILVATDAAQTGLTLTAANAVINYNLSYNPKAMDQRIDRAHRIDRKRAESGEDAYNVTAYNVIAQGTADERKLPSLAWRSKMFDVIVAGQAKADRVVVNSSALKTDEEILADMRARDLEDSGKPKKVKEGMAILFGYRRYLR